jgi:hypothetical protein
MAFQGLVFVLPENATSRNGLGLGTQKWIEGFDDATL